MPLLHRYLDRNTIEPPGDLTPDEAFADLGLPPGIGDRPYTYLNMISTLDGKAVVGGPCTTWTVGTDTDHAIFMLLRKSCDAVIAGATGIAADDMPYPRIDEAEAKRRGAAGLRPVPLWVVVSGRGNLPTDLRIFQGGRENVLVVVSEAAPAGRLAALEAVAQVRVLGESTVPMRELARVLHDEWAVRRLYSIGGPTLNAAMLEAGVLDELFMTLAPKIQGGHGMASMIEGTPYPPEDLRMATLLSLYGAGDELYMRYALSDEAKRRWAGAR